MKKLVIAIAIVLGFTFAMPFNQAEAAVKVKGYTTKKGTYVQPYYRSIPNKTKVDNYSTKGNYNPYTGKTGTKILKYGR